MQRHRCRVLDYRFRLLAVAAAATVCPLHAATPVRMSVQPQANIDISGVWVVDYEDATMAGQSIALTAGGGNLYGGGTDHTTAGSYTSRSNVLFKQTWDPFTYIIYVGAVEGGGVAMSGTWYADAGRTGSFSAIKQYNSPVYRFWSAPHSAHFYTTSGAERYNLLNLWSDRWTYETIAWYALSTPGSGSHPVYRFWSPVYQKHFYTIAQAERDRIRSTWPDVWTYEGIAWHAFPAPEAGTRPVYRFWSPVYQGHFFTLSEVEKSHIRATWPDIWYYEGVAFYAYDALLHAPP